MRKISLLTGFLLAAAFQAKSQDTASFLFTPGPGYQVYFTNTSKLQGDATRKAFWTFGDGSTQSTTPLAGVAHTYTAPGAYRVCLTIYRYPANAHDSVLSATACADVRVGSTAAPDSCSASFSDTGSLTSLTGILTAHPWHNHEKKPEEICWNFGDGHDTCLHYDPAVPSNYTVTHHYAQAGEYHVCVKIRYQGGCTSDYCHGIVVGQAQCRVEYSSKASAASPLIMQFTATPWQSEQKRILKVCWDFGDGAEICHEYPSSYTGLYTAEHAYSHIGNYTVCVSVWFDGGCMSKSCKNITVTAPVTDSCYLHILETEAAATSRERQFYALPMPGHKPVRLCWNFGDGSDTCLLLPDTLASQFLLIRHLYPAPGVYHACAVVKYAGGCEARTCREVVIRSGGTVCGGYMTDSATGGRTIVFKGFGIHNSNDPVTSWRWTFGDGSTGTGQAVTHTYASAGKYGVCLYLTTASGCETRICQQEWVQGENHPVLQLSPNPVTSLLYAAFFSALNEQMTVTIYTTTGIMVKTIPENAVAGNNVWVVDLSGLAPGMYSIIVSSPHQIASGIFIKQ